MRTLRGVVVVWFLGLSSCGGGSARSEQTTAPAGAQGGEASGDINVTIDPPAEGQFVIIDEQGRVGFQVSVRMELETLPGTSASAAQLLGRAIQGHMAQVRGCYDRAVTTDPEVEGSLELVVATDARGRVRPEVAREGFTGGRITQCVVRSLGELPRAEVPQDARVRVVLIASNTMAAGARDVREHGTQTPAPAP